MSGTYRCEAGTRADAGLWTPHSVQNPPLLSALRYRIGTHASFVRTMTARVSQVDSMAGLTTREGDDPALALIDAWAVVLDVLTFYQERLANEAFLGTATERRSILELADAIGYRIDPGVAAGTFLSFRVDDLPDSPEVVQLTAGTRVESIPSPEALPLTFETVEAIEGRAGWNAMPVQTTQPPDPLQAGATHVVLKGTETRLRRGDAILFVGDDREQDPTSERWDFRILTSVSPDPKTRTTRVTWDGGLGGPFTSPEADRVYALRESASLFGHNAPDWRTLPESVKYDAISSMEHYRLNAADRVEWPHFTILAPEHHPPVLAEKKITLFPTAQEVADAVDELCASIRQRAIQDIVTAASTALGNCLAFAGPAVQRYFGGIQEAAADFLSGGGQTLETFLNALTSALTPTIEWPDNPVTPVPVHDPDADDASVPPLDPMGIFAFALAIQEFLGGIQIKPGQVGAGSDLQSELAALSNRTSALVTSILGGAPFSQTPTPEEQALIDSRNAALTALGALPKTIAASLAAMSVAEVTKMGTGMGLTFLSALELENPGNIGWLAIALASVTTEVICLGTSIDVVTATQNFFTVLQDGGDVLAALNNFVVPDLVDDAAAIAFYGSTIAFIGVPTLIAYPQVGALLFAPLALVPALVLLSGDFVAGAESANNSIRGLVDEMLKGQEHTLRGAPYPSSNKIDLDSEDPAFTSGGWAVLTTPSHTELYAVRESVRAARTDYLLTGKTTRLTLEGEHLTDDFFDIRGTTVFAASEELEFAEKPYPDPFPDPALLDGLERLAEPPPVPLGFPRWVCISGVDTGGVKRAEICLLKETDGRDFWFERGPVHTYRRDTVRVHANVARATHGKSVSEVLGSGDASLAAQQFRLKQGPLTHVRADAGKGSQSTLEVRVDGIRWHEVSSLHTAEPTERVFETRVDDEGSVTVRFGNGLHGSRLPTGQENVTARYRIGIGLQGLVDANEVEILTPRPPGVQAVTNPIPTGGAADPEDRERARRNAPTTVLTLERIVSLRDFEDFARSFAGIAKAHAAWVWNGTREVVVLTVAAELGGAVGVGSELRGPLMSAIDAAKTPQTDFRLLSFEQRRFSAEANLLVHADHEPEVLLASIEAAAQERFGFEARELGQDVSRSALISFLQSFEGVESVDVDAFHRAELPATREAYLPAATARWSGTSVEAAELLTLHDLKLGVLQP